MAFRNFSHGAVLLAAWCVAGCTPSQVEVKQLDPTVERLSKLTQAYSMAMAKLNRPPRDANELTPFLKDQGNPAELLKSADDQEDFVVHWGVDYRKLPPRGPDEMPVLAYEKTGKGGKRYVLRYPTMITRMSAEELSKAYFPPGQKPPQ